MTTRSEWEDEDEEGRGDHDRPAPPPAKSGIVKWTFYAHTMPGETDLDEKIFSESFVKLLDAH